MNELNPKASLGNLDYLEGRIRYLTLSNGKPFLFDKNYGNVLIVDYQTLPGTAKKLMKRAIKYGFPIEVSGTLHKTYGHLDILFLAILTKSVKISEKAWCLSVWKSDSLEGALSKCEEEGGLSLTEDD